MYRRDLSPVIRFFGAALFLFILFQTWIKPAHFSPDQRELLEPPDSQPIANEPVSYLEPETLFDALQVRLIDPGHTSSAELRRIQDDLDRGNYREAEMSLYTLPQPLLAEERSKQFAAALWNNLGVQQEKFSGIEVSIKAFKQAVALAPKHPVVLLNLTQAYWGLHDEAMTPEFLESVIHAAPNDTFAHLALADVLIEHGKMAAAEQHLKLAQSRALADPYLKTYFQRLTEKLDPRVVATGSGPAQPISTSSPPLTSAHTKSPVPSQTSSAPGRETIDVQKAPHTKELFTITFDGKPDPETAMRIRAILEYAHEDMSRKFGYTPSSSIQVVLHTEQNIALEAQSPSGADALYDSGTSTIHLPIGSAMEDLAVLSRILRHQFAHALFHDKMRNQMDHVPIWLIEGLAIQLAEDPWPALEEIKQKPIPVIALSLLEKPWERSQIHSLDLAYLESASAVQSLIDSHGIYGIRQVMNLVQAGQSFESAMQHKWSVSYDQFQHDWEKAFAASTGTK